MSPDERERWLNWTVRWKLSGRALGWVQATVTAGTARAAYAVLRDERGAGIASEALSALAHWLHQQTYVERVVAEIADTNVPSMRVAAAASFRPSDNRSGDEVIWELAFSLSGRNDGGVLASTPRRNGMTEKRDDEQADLEAALPSLLDKLGALRGELDGDEQTVFDEIVRSAARHTEQVKADDVESHERIFMKPMSVHLTEGMRDEMLALPKRLGIEDQ